MYEVKDIRDKRHQPTITAKSVEEFQKIQELLDALPPTVLDKIETVRNGGVGLECIFAQQYTDGPSFPVTPPSQITDFGDYVGIYAGKYFFKIVGANYDKKKFNYNIYPFPEPKKS